NKNHPGWFPLPVVLRCWHCQHVSSPEKLVIAIMARGHSRVAFLALGSVGDVLPICEVTSRLATVLTRCIILTNRTHEAMLFRHQQKAAELVFLDIPVLPAAEDTSDSELDACYKALKEIGPDFLLYNLYSVCGFHLAEALGLRSAVCSPSVAPPSSEPSLPALGRLVPRPFLRALAMSDAKASLATIASSAPGAAVIPNDHDGESETVAPRLTVADVQHWMAPVFSSRYRSWRLRHGLAEVPFMGDTYHSDLSERGGDGSCDFQSSTGDGRPSSSTTATTEAVTVPAAIPVFYGVSELIVPKPAYWPASVEMCGFWRPPVGGGPATAATFRPLPQLESFLAAEPQITMTNDGSIGVCDSINGGGCGIDKHIGDGSSHGMVGGGGDGGGGSEEDGAWRTIVCCDFGSMMALGLVRRPARLFWLVATAAYQMKARAVFLHMPADAASSQGWQEAFSACGGGGDDSGCDSHGSGGGASQETDLTAAGAHKVKRTRVDDAGSDGNPPSSSPAATTSAAADARAVVMRSSAVAIAATSGAAAAGAADAAAASSGRDKLLSREELLSRALVLPEGEFVPHNWLFSGGRCDAVVHHGGCGTTAAALSAGLPQVIVPVAFE
ncbi:unnamed protein product, partial [Phaeothamnion confervicola]